MTSPPKAIELVDQGLKHPVQMLRQLLGAAVRAELVGEHFGQRGEAGDVREQCRTANAVGYGISSRERAAAIAGNVGLKMLQQLAGRDAGGAARQHGGGAQCASGRAGRSRALRASSGAPRTASISWRASACAGQVVRSGCNVGQSRARHKAAVRAWMPSSQADGGSWTTAISTLESCRLRDCVAMDHAPRLGIRHPFRGRVGTISKAPEKV